MWIKRDRVKCKNCLHLNVCDGMYFNLDKECERTCGYFEPADQAKKEVNFDYEAEDGQ